MAMLGYEVGALNGRDILVARDFKFRRRSTLRTNNRSHDAHWTSYTL